MTEALDKELNRIARLDLVKGYFKSIGSTDEQAATAAAAHAEKFVYDGTHLSFQGKPVSAPDNGIREWFTANNLDFLFPKAITSDAPAVNPALLELARGKNMTAYSRLVREHGKAVIDTLLATETPDSTENKNDGNGHDKDRATNPFSREGWSLQKQGALIRAIGVEKTAAIARSVGARIGQTRPS